MLYMKYIFVSYVDMHFIDMFLHLNNCTTKCEINTYYYSEHNQLLYMLYISRFNVVPATTLTHFISILLLVLNVYVYICDGTPWSSPSREPVEKPHTFAIQPPSLVTTRHSCTVCLNSL